MKFFSTGDSGLIYAGPKILNNITYTTTRGKNTVLQLAAFVVVLFSHSN